MGQCTGNFPARIATNQALQHHSYIIYNPVFHDKQIFQISEILKNYHISNLVDYGYLKRQTFARICKFQQILETSKSRE